MSTLRLPNGTALSLDDAESVRPTVNDWIEIRFRDGTAVTYAGAEAQHICEHFDLRCPRSTTPWREILEPSAWAPENEGDELVGTLGAESDFADPRSGSRLPGFLVHRHDGSAVGVTSGTAVRAIRALAPGTSVRVVCERKPWPDSPHYIARIYRR